MKLSGIINKVNNNHRRKGNSIMRNRHSYVNFNENNSRRNQFNNMNNASGEFTDYNNRFNFNNINSNSIIYRNQIMPNNNINFGIDED